MSDEKRNKGPDETSTEPLPGGAAGASPLRQQGVTLMVYYRDGIEEAPLAPGQPVVVGRYEPADLRIPDRKLSRRHARFTLLDGLVLVEDLGSRNGTWVAGKRIDRTTTIEFSGEATLGTVLVQVFALGRAANPSLQGEAAFHRRLAEEVTRSRFSRRPFAVLAVRADDAEVARAPTAAWVGRLCEVLRPIDRVNPYTHDIALVLAPEADTDTAQQIARALSSGVGNEGAPRLVGVALYPKDAGTEEELIARAFEASRRARPEEPVVFASTAMWTESNLADGDEDPIAGVALQEVLSKAKRVARSHIPVLLQGETGTGKEVLASFIHRNGLRRDKRLVRVNCAAIPSSLIESTLFGHEKGSFTGATQKQIGVFEAAHESTLFLDEIGELTSAVQAALLRVLEEGCFFRIGSTQDVKVDVRIIAATNRDLARMVQDGSFREDVYYRLNTEELKVPPLRERADEIERLSRRFLQKANRKDGRAVRDITEEAMALLLRYSWPGNVRELRNVIERAVAVAEGDLIQPEDLRARLHEAARQVQAAPGAAQVPVATPVPAGAVEPMEGGNLEAQLQQMEKKGYEDVLWKVHWDLAEAAKLLNVSRSKLGRKMKALGIESPKRKR